MKKIIVVSLFLTFIFIANAQDHTYNKDSVFQIVKSKMNPEEAAGFEKAYKATNEPGKHFLLSMYSLPKSSFDEQLNNLNENEGEILKIDSEFKKMVPNNYRVFVEFQNENVVYNQKSCINIGISKKGKDGLYPEMTMYNNLQPGSKELATVLKTIKWNQKKLDKVKEVLDDAHCVSVQNGERTTIGFAKNSLGMLWYVVFPTKKLTNADIKELGTDKKYTYYRNNIVFKQDGGEIGPIKFNAQ
jgi:hypothetical protein